jgi:2-polyprenyl-6-methoxyphenol hydroxylase-like FAD-dependent oxidoreductase
MTPNQGSGANNGFVCAVSLANALQNMLRSNPEPNTAAIEKAFQAYQDNRWSRGETCVRGAYDNMDMLLWSSRFKKAMTTHVVPVADKMGIIEARVNRLASKSSQFNPVLTDEAQVTIVSWDSYTNEW